MNRIGFSLFGLLALLTSTNAAWAIPTPAWFISLSFVGERVTNVATDYGKNLNPPLTPLVPRAINAEMHDSPETSTSVWQVDLVSAPDVSPAIRETITLDCTTSWYLHDKFGYVSENDCDIVQ